MKRKKQVTVVLTLGAAVAIAVSTMSAKIPETEAKAAKGEYVNLKVLPKNISSKDLQGIMTDDFEDGLGVSCGFCHAANKDGRGLDFVSDAKPEKEIARSMMRMTLGINKKFFKVKHPLIGSSSLTITCATCHKGQPFPDGDELH
jgi:cytochrome c553